MEFILFFLLIVSCIYGSEDEKCIEEFKDLQECQCYNTGQGREAYCTSQFGGSVQFIRSGTSFETICHNLDEAGLKSYAKNLKIPKTVTNVRFKLCSVPRTSYSDLINEMGMTNVRALYVINSSPNENDLIKGQFEGMGETLTTLVLQENHNLESFHPEVFIGLPNLLELRIKNNRFLRELNQDVFKPLDNLKDLELEQMSISELPATIFDPLKNLKYIRVRTNISLTSETWKHCEKLQAVHIDDLDASTLSTDWSPFQNAANLENITISGIGFSQLPPNLFSKNPKLKHFHWTLDKCLSSSPKCEYNLQNIVQNLTGLESFRIDRTFANYINITDNFFSGCDSLKSVIINKIKLNTLPENLLEHTSKLEELDLSTNQINGLPDKLLNSAVNLKKVILNGNEISSLNNQHFKHNHKLTTLEIMKNQLTVVSKKSFENLYDLEVLKLSDNKIDFTDKDVPILKTKLKYIDFSWNKIAIQDIPKEISAMTKLTHLDFSHNKFGPILNVSEFNLPQPNAMYINLSYNLIKHVSYHVPDVGVGTTDLQTPKITVDISNNPFNCDCHNVKLALHLRQKLQYHSATSWFKFDESNKNDLKCEKDKENISLTMIHLNKMVCDFRSDLNITCPMQCQCKLAPQEPFINDEVEEIIECIQVPDKIPILNTSTDHVLQDIILNLSNVNLTSLKKLRSIENYQKVNQLILSHNNLTEIPLKGLPDHQNLNQLRIDHNLLTNINDGLFKIVNLSKIWMGFNPYHCNCDSKNLFHFVKSSHGSVLVQDKNDIFLECPDDEMKKNIMEVSETSMFCISNKTAVIYVALPICLIFIMILIMCLTFLMYKRSIYIWMYSKPSLRYLVYDDGSSDDFDKPYDVFISYSNKDKDLVEEKLVPALEDPNCDFTYRCKTFHDFILGTPIMDQIVNAVESSKCTLIVLSNNYLQSDWGRHEFDIAQKHSRIIVLVYGDAPSQDLMPESLYDHLRHSGIFWDDKNFWKKLHYALPHQNVKSNMCCPSFFNRTTDRRRRKSDRLQLIQTPSASFQSSADESSTSAGSFVNIVNGTNSVGPA